VIVPRKPDESELLIRISLSHEDDSFMPPPEGGAQPFDEGELAMMKAWIRNGATFGDWVRFDHRQALLPHCGVQRREARRSGTKVVGFARIQTPGSQTVSSLRSPQRRSVSIRYIDCYEPDTIPAPRVLESCRRLHRITGVGVIRGTSKYSSTDADGVYQQRVGDEPASVLSDVIR